MYIHVCFCEKQNIVKLYQSFLPKESGSHYKSVHCSLLNLIICLNISIKCSNLREVMVCKYWNIVSRYVPIGSQNQLRPNSLTTMMTMISYRFWWLRWTTSQSPANRSPRRQQDLSLTRLFPLLLFIFTRWCVIFLSVDWCGRSFLCVWICAGACRPTGATI